MTQKKSPTGASKATTKKTARRKTTVRKTTARKSPVRKTATKKAAVRKTPARRSPTRKAPTSKAATRKKPVVVASAASRGPTSAKANPTKGGGKSKSKSRSKKKMPREKFDKELRKLQVELCHLQQWIVHKGLRIVVVFEGRDAAGKGGVLRRITERVSPRVFRQVALPAPSDREKTQVYTQRYIPHFPAAGEIILFDRSWYNRAGVERVMGFCTDQEYERFLKVCPMWEREMQNDGIILIKYFFDVSQDEQERRFMARIEDPLRHWKLSPMDVESWRRYWDYSVAYQRMIEATDTDWAPWYRVPADDKRTARLNCISHLLSVIPYKELKFTPPKAGKRKKRRAGAPKKLKFKHEIPQVY